MAGFGRLSHHPRLCFTICVCTVILSLLFSRDLRARQQQERHRRDFLNSTEIPAEHIDPAAIDLTPLVNTLINSSQLGSRQLFSLLSVTSYSSLALHKLTLLVYNISNTRSIESNSFRRRFCYCVNNDTNDLTDFTAILLDVMGNSTSYLQELFKSASILSVSQKNNSDCIYICVMAGKMGRQTPELWDVGSITPFFNQTIVEGPHQVVNGSSIRLPVGWHQLPTNLSHMSPSGMSSVLTSRVHSTAHASPAPVDETAAATEKMAEDQRPLTSGQPATTTPPPSSTTEQTETTQAKTTLRSTQRVATQSQMTGRTPQTATVSQQISTMRQADATVPTTEPHKPTTSSTTRLTSAVWTAPQLTTPTVHRMTPGPPTAGPAASGGTTGHLSWRTTTPIRPTETERPGCPWRRPELMGESMVSGVTTTVGAHKLQPCVLELCKFFSQCLCRPSNHKTRMKRYCDDSHLWYEKHTSEVCRRVRRVSFSKNLKQRCLTKMCNKL